MHYVYILESEHNEKHWYVGVTNNLKRRLEEHNAGDSYHTKKFKPWKIKNYIAFRDRSKAEKFEEYLKSKSGRALTKKHF
ncbi:GIY-YIG nuclease family protein [Patescibacteria group bacterium]|nr:GIY-YIG nuclease family protein [Patescibacteria group bacterium]MBU1123739.1 GIY-YIG nuclease family protein [Patescibacteria group bacterium]MBU1911893.1 GIY-YIG nuclease family protein [Patescibacteria group bacterium]